MRVKNSREGRKTSNIHYDMMILHHDMMVIHYNDTLSSYGNFSLYGGGLDPEYFKNGVRDRKGIALGGGKKTITGKSEIISLSKYTHAKLKQTYNSLYTHNFKRGAYKSHLDSLMI